MFIVFVKPGYVVILRILLCICLFIIVLDLIEMFVERRLVVGYTCTYVRSDMNSEIMDHLNYSNGDIETLVMRLKNDLLHKLLFQLELLINQLLFWMLSLVMQLI